MLVILAGLSFYFFYYKPHFVPRQVENADYTIQFDGTSYPCAFTGTLLNREPQGSGKYTVESNGSTTVFEGEVGDAGTFVTGTVTGLPVVIKTYSGPFTAVYDGKIIEGVMTDSMQVFEMPFSLTFDGTEYAGRYTGDLQQSSPNGEGTFKFDENDRYFTYTGSWENGQLKGNGEISSNDVVVHLPQVDRKGTYNGNTVNGVFCGKAKFSATADDGTEYFYEGNWKNGTWDGQGKLIYQNAEDLTNRIGTFTKGEFTPTILEFLSSLGTEKDSSFGISDKAREFIKNHEGFLLSSSLEDIKNYIDTSFKYSSYSKNPSRYGDKLFRVTSFQIFQVLEYSDYWGRKLTHFLGHDSSYNVYSGYFFAQSDKIAEGKTITLYALPLDYSTYKGVNNNSIWALRFVAVYIE